MSLIRWTKKFDDDNDVNKIRIECTQSYKVVIHIFSLELECCFSLATSLPTHPSFHHSPSFVLLIFVHSHELSFLFYNIFKFHSAHCCFFACVRFYSFCLPLYHPFTSPTLVVAAHPSIQSTTSCRSLVLSSKF